MKYAIQNHGSVVLVCPQDDECRQWLKNNVQEDAQWWNGSLVVEPRYLENLLYGLENPDWLDELNWLDEFNS